MGTDARFESGDLKLDWGGKHWQDLAAEIQQWLGEDHGVDYERNEDGTQHYLRSRFHSTPDFNRWGLMAGDCLAGIRDALDHFVYGMANSTTGNAVNEKAAFVITKNEESFKKEASRKLRGLSPAAVEVVYEAQPFRRAEGEQPTELSLLAELVNASKHRVLKPALAIPITLPFAVTARYAPKGRVGIPQTGISDGEILFVFETDNPMDEDLVFGPLHFDVALTHTRRSGRNDYWSDRTPLIDLIGDIALSVHSIGRRLRAAPS